MTANYVLLEKITVGAAGASSVTFTGIPQTGYTDLVIKSSVRSDRAANTDWCYVSFNGSTSSFSAIIVGGSGSGLENYNGFPRVFGAGTAANVTASTFANSEIYIPNYTSANFKSWSSDQVTENNATAAEAQLVAGLWSSTAAITSITLAPRVGPNFVANSTFYLYGVAKLGTTPVIVPYATGGDTIMTDGTYWYHAFLSSGTFTPQKGLSSDILVVAGGGGGAGQGGGGGAGGIAYANAYSLASSTPYTITVGAGGSGAANGTNSAFASITGVGGGRASGRYESVAFSGGSGGSGSWNGGNGSAGGSSTQTSGTGYVGYGNAGGTSSNFNSLGYEGYGGGGGAGAAGANGTSGAAGAGGNGLNTWSTWASVTGTGVSGYYAGGGGGGYSSIGSPSNGGLGGGGNGAQPGTGTNAIANTGGGAGGSGGSGGAASGGSGIVIVRYAV
jgi:hypothetical protein